MGRQTPKGKEAPAARGGREPSGYGFRTVTPASQGSAETRVDRGWRQLDLRTAYTEVEAHWQGHGSKLRKVRARSRGRQRQ